MSTLLISIIAIILLVLLTKLFYTSEEIQLPDYENNPPEDNVYAPEVIEEVIETKPKRKYVRKVKSHPKSDEATKQKVAEAIKKNK